MLIFIQFLSGVPATSFQDGGISLGQRCHQLRLPAAETKTEREMGALKRPGMIWQSDLEGMQQLAIPWLLLKSRSLHTKVYELHNYILCDIVYI